jgi:ferric-dicitrate binding protein FerR (iron transport regulator)
MSPSGDWDLIDRYLAGECSPEQAAEVERLLAARPDLAEIVAAVRSALEAESAAEPTGDWDADAASARLARTIAGDTGARHRTPPPLRVVGGSAGSRRFDIPGARTGWRRWAAAAAVVVAAGSAGLWLKIRDRTHTSPPVAAPPMREIVTGRGQRAAFNLSDGSRVVLAAESRLRVPAGYNTLAAGGRPVYLEGQGWFEVRHDSTRPFEVRTMAGVARDLGTEFVVSAYPGMTGMRVAVAHGAVALRAPSTAPLLSLFAGDLATLDTAGVATLTRGADLAPYLAWKDGTLVFDGTRLGDALVELGRWYDLEIRLAEPSLAERRLTATFTNEPAPQVIERIARVLRLEMRRDGRVVTLVVPRPIRIPS